MTRPTWQTIVETDSLIFLLVAGFLVRLAIIPLFYDDYNYWAFGVFTNFFLHGQNPYHVVSQDPTLLNINVWRYPPLYLLFTAPALMAKQFTGQTLAYLAALKIPFAVADIVSTFYLFKILTRFLPPRDALKFSAFFAFNPLVIFESSGGGFNDPIAIAFTVASVFYLIKSRDEKVFERRNLSKSAVFLGLGIATKIYPILLIPVLIREVRGTGQKLVYTLLALLPALAVSAPFLYWDYLSYFDLLTIRNVGGQHPLFPGLGLGRFVGPLVVAFLGVLLLLVYVRNLSLISRLALVFLWVNLAVFAQSFNYMVWGIPFFTLLAAEYRKLFLMPLSPVVTLFVAFLFQGSYDRLRGSAGLFYWTYHLFRLPVVPFIEFPWLGIVGFLTLSISEAVAGYYFVRVFLKVRLPTGKPQQEVLRIIASGSSRKRAFLSILFLGLVVLSWGFVAEQAVFLPHQYPAVVGSSFQFTGDLQSSLLDYQWAFSGEGVYTINPMKGSVEITALPKGTAELFRGWGSLVDGFHRSSNAVAKFLFRFDGFSPNSDGMILANMTDGQLAVQIRTVPDLVYLDQVSNQTIQIGKADSSWHNFTMQYTPGVRILEVDGSKWTLAGSTFARLMFGNTNRQQGYGGTAEFSSVTVEVNDFPTGYQAQSASALALITPPLFVVSLFALMSDSVRHALRRLKVEIARLRPTNNRASTCLRCEVGYSRSSSISPRLIQ